MNLKKLKEIERDFASVINKHSLENLSNTPDFIIARLLISTIINFSSASKLREKWYGKFLSIGQTVKCTSCNYKNKDGWGDVLSMDTSEFNLNKTKF